MDNPMSTIGKRENFDVKPVEIQDRRFFADGKIQIIVEKCRGMLCQSCINACPTKAIYWKAYPGNVEISEKLCIFCTACVLSCPVKDCIIVYRRRSDGRLEIFSSKNDVLRVLECVNSRKRIERAKAFEKRFI